jgi:hypothetical protein
MRSGKAFETFSQHLVDGIDELLHERLHFGDSDFYMRGALLALPRSQSLAGWRIGVIFLEVALNERGQGGNRGMGVATAGAKMENRVLSRFRRHHLHDAFCIDPRAVGRQRQFDARREGLGKLGKPYGRTRMKSHIMSENHRSMSCRFGHHFSGFLVPRQLLGDVVATSEKRETTSWRSVMPYLR